VNLGSIPALQQPVPECALRQNQPLADQGRGQARPQTQLLVTVSRLAFADYGVFEDIPPRKSQSGAAYRHASGVLADVLHGVIAVVAHGAAGRPHRRSLS